MLAVSFHVFIYGSMSIQYKQRTFSPDDDLSKDHTHTHTNTHTMSRATQKAINNIYKVCYNETNKKVAVHAAINSDKKRTKWWFCVVFEYKREQWMMTIAWTAIFMKQKNSTLCVMLSAEKVVWVCVIGHHRDFENLDTMTKDLRHEKKRRTSNRYNLCARFQQYHFCVIFGFLSLKRDVGLWWLLFLSWRKFDGG